MQLFQTFSNVRVIIRIKISNEKEQFYPLGIFLAAMVGGLVRYLVSTWLPASPDFPLGHPPCQLSGHFLPGLSGERLSGL